MQASYKIFLLIYEPTDIWAALSFCQFGQELGFKSDPFNDRFKNLSYPKNYPMEPNN